MGFFGDSGGYEDPIVPAWQGGKAGVGIGMWMGTAAGVIFGLLFKFVIFFVIASVGALGDFIRRFVALWQASKQS